MKLTHFFLIIGALVLHTQALGMLPGNREKKCYFCANTFVKALLDKHGMKSDAFRAWDNNFGAYERGEERFQFAKKLNARYSLELDAIIDDIENSVDEQAVTLSNPASAQPQTTAHTNATIPQGSNPIYMNEQEKQLAINTLNQQIWNAVESNHTAEMDLSMSAHLFKEDMICSASAQATAPAHPIGMNDQKKQDAIDALSSAMGEKINIECANGKRSVLSYDWTILKPTISNSEMFGFLRALNKSHTLGFDTEIQMIEHRFYYPFHTFIDVGPITQDDIKNGIAEEPTSTLTISQLGDASTVTLDPSLFVTEEDRENAIGVLLIGHLSDSDDDEEPGINPGGSPSFTAEPVTITEQDKRNLRGYNPPSGNIPARARSSMFQHGLQRANDEPEQQPARPAYTTTRFIRSPLFVGIIALCLSAGVYHYWQEQKKKPQLEDADAESNGPENVSAL